jgi:hypothetical protein
MQPAIEVQLQSLYLSDLIIKDNEGGYCGQ